jgi:hypothetical protein
VVILTGMKAGITGQQWSIEEIVGLLDNGENSRN